ncbi:MAG: rod shape-determining protein RodA [Bacteroidetes bacterium]|jgi:rod shape determining protein RodA|nr:rod shape-determining protein RodA [Bacteroidota bacterium]
MSGTARRQQSVFQYVDKPLLLSYVALCILGLLTIYSSVYDAGQDWMNQERGNAMKQLAFVGVAWLSIVVVLSLDSRFFEGLAPIFYLIFLFLSILVAFVGNEINGARAWFSIGGFGLQPGEFLKLGTILMIAFLLREKSTQLRSRSIKNALFVVILLPVASLLLQKDTGSALVYASFLLVLYREGMSPLLMQLGIWALFLGVLTLLFDEKISSGIVLGLAFIYILLSNHRWRSFVRSLTYIIPSLLMIASVEFAYDKVLQPHQKKRIDVLLGKVDDVKGAGYNVHQSLIAIGSGGFLGKGYLQGTQTKFDFVPEQSTDFIFCTIGEEFGFVGSILLLLLYLFVLFRILHLSEMQGNRFGRVYGYGLVSVLFAHIVVNIGMTIGLLPVIGIPLPLLSYGGSSQIAFGLMVGIMLRLDSGRRTGLN